MTHWQESSGCCDSPDEGEKDAVTHMTKVNRMLWLSWQERSGCDWPDKGNSQCCDWPDKNCQDDVTDLTKVNRMLQLTWQECSGCCDSSDKGAQNVVTHLARAFRMQWLTWQECSGCCDWPCCWRCHVVPWSPSCLATDWRQREGKVSPRSSSLPPRHPHPYLHPRLGWRRRTRSPAGALNTHTVCCFTIHKTWRRLSTETRTCLHHTSDSKISILMEIHKCVTKKTACSVHFSLLQNDLCCYSTDGILSTDGKIWCLINPAILTHHQHMKHHHLQTDTHVQSILKSTPLAMHQDLSDTMSAKHRDPAVFCCLIHHSRPGTRTCVCLTSTRNLPMSGLTWSSGTWAAAGDRCLAVWPADRGVSWATCTLLTYTATL